MLRGTLALAGLLSTPNLYLLNSGCSSNKMEPACLLRDVALGHGWLLDSLLWKL